MKKLMALALAAAMTLSLTACNGDGQSSSESESTSQSDSSAQRETVRIAGLKGPTAIGMVKLMSDNENGSTANAYEFTLAGSPDEIVGSIVTGELDIAAVPTNLAATLSQKTEGKVQMTSVITLGVLYVVDTSGEINSIEDLRGKTIYATGKGSTPEFALNYILSESGINPETDVTVEYKTESTEIAQLLAAGQGSIAVLPQPFVSSVLANNENARIALNLTEEWSKVTDGESQFAMSAIIVQRAFVQEHPETLAKFLEEYGASTAFVTDEANLDAAAELVGKYEIVGAAIAKQAIPYCNIVNITGDEMKNIASAYLEVLFNADAKSVGGALPDETFYYTGK